MDNLQLSQLSAGERMYYQPDPQISVSGEKVITLPSRANDPEDIKNTAASFFKLRINAPEKWAEIKETQKAKRKKVTAIYNQQLAEANAVEREKTRLFREKQALQEKEQRERFKAENRKVKETAKAEKKGPDASRCKIPAGRFEPVIGKPNRLGETPVQVDAKTTIMVQAGRDIQKVIIKYQIYLTNKA